jgi:hypothetical protein
LEDKATDATESSVEELEELKNTLEESYKKLACSKSEKALIDRLFRRFKDKISDTKRSRLLDVSSGQRDQYQALTRILEEMKQRKTEVRLQLETYRKVAGGSSLDFERSMATQELMETEKESLERISSAIKEVEEKMAQIKG